MNWLRRFFAKDKVPVAPVVDERKPMKISDTAIGDVGGEKWPPRPWHAPDVAPGVIPSHTGGKYALDSMTGGAYGWANGLNNVGGTFSEGIQYMGGPYLAELTQRAEYRRPSEIIAKQMTRKWIKFVSTSEADKTAKIKIIEDEFKRLDVQGTIRRGLELDGFFGRAHIYIDVGVALDDKDEIITPMALTSAKVPKDSLKRLVVVDPIWTYPNTYDSTNPLRPDFYNPQSWYVMGSNVHASRLLTIVGRPVPDILKPAYAFGGLSLSQMAKPYVDNWLRTRQSVSDLLHAFTVWVLKTDMSQVLTGGNGAEVRKRMILFNKVRDNRGAFVIDKNTEEFENVSAPVAGLDHLQAQAQEHMCLEKGTLIETRRGQIRIENVIPGDEVMTRDGYAPVAWAGITKYTSQLIEIKTEQSVIRSTVEHPIWSATTSEFVPAQNVNVSHRLLKSRAWGSMANRSLGAVGFGVQRNRGISETLRPVAYCIALSMKRMSALFRARLTSTTSTKIATTINPQTYDAFLVATTLQNTSLAGSWFTSARRIKRNAQNAECTFKQFGSIARFIALRPANTAHTGEGATPTMKSVRGNSLISGNTTKRADPVKVVDARIISRDCAEPVYDITVEKGFLPEFFANGILVHNSAVTGIPLSILLGITPTGLNPNSEGDDRKFYDWIEAQQESTVDDHVRYIMNVVMLSKFGEIDSEINFTWNPLWTMSDKERGEIDKNEAETDNLYYEMGAIDSSEVRARLANKEDSPYTSLDLDKMITPPSDGNEDLLGGEVDAGAVE